MSKVIKPLPEWEAETAPCPFENDKFLELWVSLLKMPKWKKKPLSAIELACKMLKRFDVDFAASLVETAISGNYQGVVFPDTNRKYEIYKSKINGGQQRTSDIIAKREAVNTELNRRNYQNR